jgi:hypothetical protein
MWWSLVQLPALVLLDGVSTVDVHGAVRVNRHHHLADVGVDTALLKPAVQERKSTGNSPSPNNMMPYR